MNPGMLALWCAPLRAWKVISNLDFSILFSTEQLTFYSASDIGSDCVTISDQDAVGITSRCECIWILFDMLGGSN